MREEEEGGAEGASALSLGPPETGCVDLYARGVGAAAPGGPGLQEALPRSCTCLNVGPLQPALRELEFTESDPTLSGHWGSDKVGR